MLKTKNGRTVLSPKCAVSGSKKSRFMKKQEAQEILCNLDVKTPLRKSSIIWWHFVLMLLF